MVIGFACTRTAAGATYHRAASSLRGFVALTGTIVRGSYTDAIGRTRFRRSGTNRLSTSAPVATTPAITLAPTADSQEASSPALTQSA